MDPEFDARAKPGELPRVLGPTAALCVVVGSVIGSGIFIVRRGWRRACRASGGSRSSGSSAACSAWPGR
jgi:cytosine/adenosine deaminase-related metal-dependent hydrolase